MIPFNAYFTPEQARAYIEQFPSDAIFEAARAHGWKFSRGRPSKDGLLNTWAISYPHWLPRVASWLNNRHNGTIPTPAPIPEELKDDPIPAPAPSVDLSGIHSAIAELRATDNALTQEIRRGITIAHSAETRVVELETRIKELEKRAPVQFTFGDITLPPITGQHFNFPRMVRWLKLKKNVLLIGPAGTGKTTAAIKFAEMLKLNFYSQPLTMDAFGVFGYTAPDGKVIDTEFSRAWKLGGVFLWDEMSMSSADALGALNAALANRLAPLPGVGTVPPHPDFYMIGADNSDTGASLKFAARTMLDGASLDRFIRIDWPIDPAVESAMANGSDDWLTCVRAVRAFIDSRDIQHVGATPRAVIAGAEALASGVFSRVEILEDTLKKGVLIDSWPEVLRLPEVKEFLAGDIL